MCHYGQYTSDHNPCLHKDPQLREGRGGGRGGSREEKGDGMERVSHMDFNAGVQRSHIHTDIHVCI